jgi:HK97 family phage major capsid protein
MGATDQMLARYAAEIEERQAFIDGLVQSAGDGDLSPEKAELVTEARKRMDTVQTMMAPLIESRRISDDSAQRVAEIAKFMQAKPAGPQEVEYRSAGEYTLDMWRGGMGDHDANNRLEIYHRAAAHQTTADNPGLIPAPILGPVVSFIDANRPLVTQLGPRNLPGATWTRPKVTQHTDVAAQSAEKAELVSQKMTITKLTGNVVSYGGYVNISRQDLDFTTPGILDVVVGDLASVYAVKTEAAAASAFDTASTAGVPIATGAATAAGVAASLWDAASKIYTATKGAGRVFAVTGPDMLPILAPVFPPVNPQNAISAGFSAGDMGTGLVASVSGIPLYVSGGIGTLRILVFSTAAAEVYEQRVGTLQVVEPSVLGLQVAYFGYFTPMVIESTAIIKIVKTP